MTKVTIIFSSLGIGGAEASLTRMASYRRTKISYKIVSIGRDGNLPAFLSRQGILHKIYDLPPCPTAFREFLVFYNCIRVVQDAINDNQSIIYACGYRISCYVRLILLLMPGPLFVLGVRANPQNLRISKVLNVIERVLSPLTSHYISNSQSAKDFIVRHWRVEQKKISIIYNGINLNHSFRYIPLSYRPRIVLVVANHSPRKGLIEFLLCIQKIIAIDSDIRFYFAGSENPSYNIKSHITRLGLSRHVQILGYQEDVISLLGQSRCLVLPSLYGEGCPTCILEAYATRTPVVAHSIDGVPEIVENGVTGLTHHVNDPTMPQSILMMVNCTEYAEGIADNAYNKLCSDFSIESVYYKHETLLSLLDRRKA